MASHGIPRASEVPRTDVAQERERTRIQAYRELVDLVQTKIRERQYTVEVLDLTSKLLVENPEYYTIWNHRRRILNHFFHAVQDEKRDSNTEPSNESPSEPGGDIERRITDDLHFLVPLLVEYPKCYWIWNHRRWLLQQVPLYLSPASTKSFWTAELGLVSKMLSRDHRNFHGWGYRRTIVAVLESLDPSLDVAERSMARSELDYTTKMIRAKLENFSAWHARSRLIPRLLEEKGASDEERKAMLNKELSWIQDAIYTDPYNQSLWFYHHNLMCTFDPALAPQTMAPGLTNDQRRSYLHAEIDNIIEAREGGEDCKYIYQTLIELAVAYSKVSDGDMPPQAQNGSLRKWVDELRALDPLRGGRWDDLVGKLNLDI